MTVSEFIRFLQSCPPDADITAATEGDYRCWFEVWNGGKVVATLASRDPAPASPLFGVNDRQEFAEFVDQVLKGGDQ